MNAAAEDILAIIDVPDGIEATSWDDADTPGVQLTTSDAVKILITETGDGYTVYVSRNIETVFVRNSVSYSELKQVVSEAVTAALEVAK